ncbi:MAG: hypothetical protein ACREFU_00940, partial [Acetobacteraceae bacterium]
MRDAAGELPEGVHALRLAGHLLDLDPLADIGDGQNLAAIRERAPPDLEHATLTLHFGDDRLALR